MSGLFYVYCDTGAKVDDADFNEWYDEIHIPELFTLKGFIDGQRYFAADSLTPYYLTTVTVDTPDPTSIINSQEFKSLVEGASPRERRILTTAQTVNRRDLETIFEYPPPSSSPVPRNPVPKYLFVALVDILEDSPAFEEELNRWYNDVHIPDIAKTAGWTRSRRFKLKESVELNPNTDSTIHLNTHKYLALHEFTTDHNQYMSDPAMLAAMQTEEVQALLPKLKLEMRHFVLHKSW
ncbi:hypothetical protein BJ165DRAFT_1511067 [Panaeolus papilionaceus]|nr:hypothetical protein BJ165DRAFT_1511067 [Panaeolus papilionaceus]